MEQQGTITSGFFLSLYCVLSIIVGFGLFMFALLGLKNLSTGPDGFGRVVFLFFVIAFANFFIVYKLLSDKIPMTIYLVRAYEGIKVILTFFALFTAGPEAIFYLLFVLLWLLYFFKSPRVKAIYFSEQNVMHVTT